MKVRVTFEVPEGSLDRLQSAYESKDPALQQYLSGALPGVLRQLSAGRLDADLTRLGSPIRVIDAICTRFPRVVKRLQNRHANRPTISVSDEYDVQDILDSLLSVHFSDIRREEWVPSYAGKSARADFLLKKEQVFIEVKVVTPKLKEPQLHDQLLVDIAHYRKHPDCKKLVCFVYDPERLLMNPEGIENDLRCEESEFQIHVRVAPKDG